MKKTPLLLLILLIGSQVFSQDGSHAYRKNGDTQYKHHHYQSAIDFYTKALKKSPEPGNIMLLIAKSYLKINHADEAEKWYIKARENKAVFSIDDYYQYSRALVTLKKRNQADALLTHVVETDPNSYLARRALSDLRDFEKYYQDSASVLVDSLSINTSVAEFAPVYYKEGIVFTSARHEGFLRKKYHWDNSYFLNLYYSRKTGEKQFGVPELFEKDLNTRYHVGPAIFYSKYQKMILNRNQTLKVVGTENAMERHLALFEAVADEGKSTWKAAPLPFNDPAYSYAHPSISENGDTLYFVSNQAGGYGGTDIYRVVRTNGAWGKPFNVGPSVNSAENEVFPFFIDNTLYFASNGHGGLGGLDLFKSTRTVNGFSPPLNLGYPMNSSADDFSFITRIDQRNGYFASSRKGNDDLFYFEKPPIKIMAYIYDSLTHIPLSGANIQIITNNGNDSTLNADSEGNFTIEVPEETAYVIVGTKDDKIGMVSDIADQSKSHRIPAYGDTSRIACIGFIENEKGLPKEASLISILDETTGEKIEYPGDTSQITFLGEKGHDYKIDVQDSAGHQASHKLSIGLKDKDPKTFTMILPDAVPLNMAARVFRGDDNQPLANANVKVITFAEDDKELTTDEKGMVDFTLKEGTDFLIVGTKDDLTGKLSGMAERGVTDKETVILPVPLYGDKVKGVLAVGLVTNTSGVPVDAFKATVTNKKTGEQIPVDTKTGLMTFQGDHGQSYNIAVSHNDYKTTLQEVVLPESGPDVHKFTVILENKQSNKMILPLASAESTKIADNIKTGKSELLVVDTDKGTSKAYILSGKTLSEITERDSLLYHETPRGNAYLGKGELSDLRTNPSSVLKGVEKSDLTKLRNIYFDFDKADLDADDEKYLLQVKSILDLDHTSKLIVAGHADDRGSDEYNIKLSQRRVQAVSKYLMSEGIPKDRIIPKAYGESLPVVPCHGTDCTEEDHQKNRRAEFVLSQYDITTPHSSKTTGQPRAVVKQ